MSQQKRFEGPDVRVLLDEISATYGAGTTIARAETFRSGGILGFFARERYRLVVDESTVGGPAPATGTPSGTAADAQEVTPDPVVAGVAAALAYRAATVESTDPFVDLADEMVDDTELSLGPAPAATSEEPVTEPVDFEQILAALVKDGAPAAEPVSWPPATPVGEDILGADLVADRDPAAAMPAPEPAGAPGRPSAPIRPPVLRLRAGRTSGGRPVVRASVRTSKPRFEDAAVFETATSAPEFEPPADPVPPRWDSWQDRLCDAGLDPWSVQEVEDGVEGGRSLQAALFDLFESQPALPTIPSTPGSVVVVVGESHRVAEEAARIARDAGAGASSVLYASQERVHIRPAERHRLVVTPQEAAAAMAEHRRWRVGVVAVEASVGGPATWVREMIAAVGADHVVAVVDALHKTDDVKSWVEAIGGADSLVLDNPERTSSPAAIFALDVPVTRFGERAASSLQWAALLLDLVGDLAPAGLEVPSGDAYDDEPATVAYLYERDERVGSWA